MGQIFVLSKDGSWVPVDACNFFLGGGSLIRACTGSFGNVFGVKTSEIKWVKFFSVRKGGHGP